VREEIGKKASINEDLQEEGEDCGLVKGGCVVGLLKRRGKI
jgi:hypothetical protein